MSLQTYRRKRDFRKTSEPKGGGRSRRGKRTGLRFVVQKHAATRLHYDFRLELDGVLKSWAVPKGPSLDPDEKRLAVEVEDHPIDYADFEGVIPKGQYGGGTVMVWDRGTWSTEDADPSAALRAGKLSFQLKGEKLTGGWTLVRLKDKGEKPNWLLMKQDDDEATGENVLEKFKSAKTGRTMAVIANEADAVWDATRKGSNDRKPPTASRPKRNVLPSRSSGIKGVDPAHVDGAMKGPVPRGLSPQLCTPAETAPSGPAWIHEIKFDGYRLLAFKTRGSVKLITRAGKDWTARFRPIARAVAEMKAASAVVDGEAVIQDAKGRTSFQQLQQAIKTKRFDRLTFMAFDLPYCDGFDLTRTPLLKRKAILKTLIGEGNGVLQFSEHVRGEGGEMQRQACRSHLEGVVCKRIDAPYASSRNRDWLKVKCSKRQELVVVGWTAPGGGRKHFGSLLLGAHDSKGRLVYTGRVGTGFSAATLKDLKGRMALLATNESPLDVLPTAAESRGVHWVRPVLVCEIEFTEWTDDGRLRHPSFQGLREDKSAATVTIESKAPIRLRTPAGEESMPKKRARPVSMSAAGKRQKQETPTVHGVVITHPDRVVDEAGGLTKIDLVQYYDAIADRILPFLVDRPLSTVRCPTGRNGGCFFQKHMGGTFSAPVKSIRVKEKSGQADYIAIDSAEGLITLIQFGVIELHPWGSRKGTIEKPDMMSFDLDPGPGVGQKTVIAGAKRVREVLGDAGLESFVKTSGGKGLHVVAPLQPKASWDTVKNFARAVATFLTREEPENYIDTLSKAKREGKIFIDYLRNGRGSTSVAPYSVRAREKLPISLPVAWSAIGRLHSSHGITIADIRKLTRRADPWEDFFNVRQSLEESLAKGLRDSA